MTLPVQIKVLDERVGSDFMFPAYQSDMAAGIDLIACIDEPVTIEPGETVLIPTGIATYVADPNYAAVILPRSGLGHKKGLVLGNGTGLIDADYQGQIFVSAWNRNQDAEREVTVNPGDRIAQLVFLPVARASFEIVSEFHEVSERGEGGFGSTGVTVPRQGMPV